MPSRRMDWRIRHGPRGHRHLVYSQGLLLACQGLPDNKKD